MSYYDQIQHCIDKRKMNPSGTIVSTFVPLIEELNGKSIPQFCITKKEMVDIAKMYKKEASDPLINVLALIIFNLNVKTKKSLGVFSSENLICFSLANDAGKYKIRLAGECLFSDHTHEVVDVPDEFCIVRKAEGVNIGVNPIEVVIKSDPNDEVEHIYNKETPRATKNDPKWLPSSESNDRFRKYTSADGEPIVLMFIKSHAVGSCEWFTVMDTAWDNFESIGILTTGQVEQRYGIILKE